MNHYNPIFETKKETTIIITIAKISVMSTIVINVPTRELMAGETKSSSVSCFQHLNNRNNVCKQISSLYHIIIAIKQKLPMFLSWKWHPTWTLLLEIMKWRVGTASGKQWIFRRGEEIIKVFVHVPSTDRVPPFGTGYNSASSYRCWNEQGSLTCERNTRVFIKTHLHR